MKWERINSKDLRFSATVGSVTMKIGRYPSISKDGTSRFVWESCVFLTGPGIYLYRYARNEFSIAMAKTAAIDTAKELLSDLSTGVQQEMENFGVTA